MSAILMTLLVLAPAPLIAPVQSGEPMEPGELDSTVTAVTVYTSSAYVQRTAEAPAGGGVFVLRGLPSGLDREAIRVRCEGAEVTSVETRERLVRDTPVERIAELRTLVDALVGRAKAEADEDAVFSDLHRYLTGLLVIEERSFASGLMGPSGQGGDGGGLEARAARTSWLDQRLVGLATARRELAERRAATQRELDDARARLGGAEQGSGTRVVDLRVELVDTSGAPASLSAEYLVPNAGWTPAYDLRTPKDLSKVELVYRADVRQRTGEDWNDVELLLSTAEPRRGAAGPEPRLETLALGGQPGSAGWFLGDGYADRKEVSSRKQHVSQEDENADGLPLEPTEILVEGLSVRYRLPRRETVESRPEASTVLIGRADLAVSPEHVVVPELDETVWLRGRSRNTSPWVLLPGRASVYFGNDFLGQASLRAVQPGEELVLHLGADPGLAVTRTVLKDEVEAAGMFSSRETLHRKVRFEVRNLGGFSPARDGIVNVTVHESIPRATDERVKVSIERAEPKPAQGTRWDALRDEQSVESWVLRVPRGETRTIDLVTEIAYPEDLRLTFR